MLRITPAVEVSIVIRNEAPVDEYGRSVVSDEWSNDMVTLRSVVNSGSNENSMRMVPSALQKNLAKGKF